MNSEAVLTVSAVVVALTQFLKWGKIITDRRGPLAVMALAMLGVTVWTVSFVDVWTRSLVFGLFAAWINITLSAAGAFGFTRSMPEAVTSTKEPPSGAGSNPTT